MRLPVRLSMVLTIPLAILLPAASVASAAPGPWWADYFPNPNLEGAPVLSRMDSAIGFDWGLDSPGPGLPADNFSVRWTRDEWFAGGTYRFLYRSDDGIRIRVGDELVLDEWHERQATWAWVDRYIPEGVHTVVIEYYERTGAAAIEVGWEKVVGSATWRGEYYGNRDLQGSPTLIRDEEAIDFDWGSGGPDPTLPADNFSVRWTRVLGFTAGTYRFLASCDDGVRIYVDGNLVVNAWQKQKLPNTRTGEIALSEGQHTVTVEYFEEGGEAAAHVWWERRDVAAGWQGLYYDNPDLVGGPALIRDDPKIDFDWGVMPPVDWMPDDHFSIRWTRTVAFEPGYYIFKVESDDGMRFWLDGALVINKWRPMQGELHYLDGVYLEGPHTLMVEYFEQNGNARIHFWWERSTPWGVMPRALDPTLDPWEAQFFANPSLEGTPALVRVDTALDHDWGLGAPAPGLPADGFSVRWIQVLSFDSGTYRFVTTTDDGVRLWVDDRLLIDAWRPMRSTRTATIWLEAGVHQVRMEYFERSGAALAQLTWYRVSQTPAQPVSTQPAHPSPNHPPPSSRGPSPY